jgi:hypothetical protein
MKLKYSFVCDSANISLQGNLNALGIFSTINAPKYPVTYGRFFYVANIVFHRSEAGPHKFKLSFVNDDGRDIISPVEGDMNVTIQALSNNLMLDLNGITFPSPGIYQIDLSVDNIYLGSETINVAVADRTLQQ